MRTRSLGALAGMLLAAVSTYAAKAADSSHGAISLLVENDLFFNTDRHYTNGIGFAYTTPALDPDHWAVDAANVLPFFQKEGQNLEVRATYELGQDMFTPEATALVVPDPNDRPYAGYLFGAVGVLSKSDERMDQLQLQLGMIGPASLAEDAQKFVHSIIHVAKPRGWSYQLRDEPGLELTYDRAWRTPKIRIFDDIDFDLGPHLGAAVGNVYDYANAGFVIRGGFALPDDFGPMRLDPSLPGSNFFEPTSSFSAYAFAGVDGRAVVHNIFLDGNTFQASRSVDRNILVGDLLIGAAVETDWARITFTHVFRSKEFKTQTSTDQFGAVNLTFRL
jgi:hypothetical protein